MVPRVYIEELLEFVGPGYNGLYEVKFYCFNGIVVLANLYPLPQNYAITRGEDGKITWQLMQPMRTIMMARGYDHPWHTQISRRPKCLARAVTIASRLSAEMGHVRVDLFLTDDGPCEKSVVLGELTYASTGGREWFHPREIENDMAMLWNVVPPRPRHAHCAAPSRRQARASRRARAQSRSDARTRMIGTTSENTSHYRHFGNRIDIELHI